MLLRGELIAESPIYRGNARKTLFTRDGDGRQRLVSLAGEISGTAQALMDAFIGESRNGRNTGLLNQLWRRLYGESMPSRLIEHVDCRLQKDSYLRDHFFDLRMGIKLDEDRWAAEANANYKMETLMRHSVFDLTIAVDDEQLKRGENETKLYYVLRELQEGRFWFGAGKSKGLGRCRLKMDLPFSPAGEVSPSGRANVLEIRLGFSAENPVLVGWNWGKVDPETPVFASVDGGRLVEALQDMHPAIRERLAMAMAGPVVNGEEWKQKFSRYLRQAMAAWLRERSATQGEVWVVPQAAADGLRKGKHRLSKELLERLQPLVDKPFASEEELREALGAAIRKGSVTKRVMKLAEKQVATERAFNQDAWRELAEHMGIDAAAGDALAGALDDEAALADAIGQACEPAMQRYFEQIDRQISLLQSDAWVEAEIAEREEHVRIKEMLASGAITEAQWNDPDHAPEGVKDSVWREFLAAHERVQYRHMTDTRNLEKSIVNDRNFIEFLQAYRERARQELAQPRHTDFRAGGPGHSEVSRKYGKPYDTIFMRMLSWAPSPERRSFWEVYIPGSTLKGAFRKRAAQVLRTLWGETPRAEEMLARLFGAQSRNGLLWFSDAYLVDPEDQDKPWCSMDGVRMDPQTGKPVEQAKADYLFAYGRDLEFRFSLYVQDIEEEDEEALLVLRHLLRDLQRGDIAIGGAKTSGMGWVQARVESLLWLTTDPDDIGKTLWGERTLTEDGVWRRLELAGDEAAAALEPPAGLAAPDARPLSAPPRAKDGFVSHRLFGGWCGVLEVEGEALTPVAVMESGEPSFTTTVKGQPVNGWDFFSLSPPEADRRGAERLYALPSKTLRGLLRHLYSIASDSRAPSQDLSRLNPADSLFGWVGRGPNQAIAGRLAFSFGRFDAPELGWFKAPYPYGRWRYEESGWRERAEGFAEALLIAGAWRVFPHAPLAPIVQPLSDFQPDTPQAAYFRAVLPGARCRFSIRFWNLEEAELRRLVWCVMLEPELAHKVGRSRYLGFGSIRFRILPESFLVNWAGKYGAGGQEDKTPLNPQEWADADAVAHLDELRKALNAGRL